MKGERRRAGEAGQSAHVSKMGETPSCLHAAMKWPMLAMHSNGRSVSWWVGVGVFMRG